jgi:hypothetical protein
MGVAGANGYAVRGGLAYGGLPVAVSEADVESS